MMISVIVPVWNAEHCLSRCVDSILAQTHTDLELILVNDGSTDASGALCDAYAAKDPRVKVIHKANGGPSAARNAGIDAASGDYIAFADNDDFMDRRQLAYLLALCLENDVSMAVCSYEIAPMDAVPAAEPAPLQSNGCEVIDPWQYIERLCTPLQVLYVVPWGKLYRRDLFNRVRYPEKTLNEDDCVIHTLALQAQRIAVSYAPLHFYCTNPESISRKGIPIEPWIRSIPYKEDRMAILRKNRKWGVLYRVQRLFFYNLLLERSRLPAADRSHRRILYRNAFKTWLSLLSNPSASRREAASMLRLLAAPDRIIGKRNEDFLV